MKQRLPEFEEKLCEAIKQCYRFDASSYIFIPIGDTAFSYVVENTKGERRYLKVFDTATQKGRLAVERLNQYLPLMIELIESGLFCDLPRPYHTTNGDLRCNWGRFIGVLFEYVDGKTLENDYPFSDDVQTRIAVQLAKLHAVPLTELHSQVVRESYSVDFGESLHSNLRSLDSYTGDDLFVLKLQSIVLPRLELINRFWERLCELREIALQSEAEVVLCHGDLWGGNIIDQGNRRLVFLDWEGAVIAPLERDLFSYLGPDYTTFRIAYAAKRQIAFSLNPDLVAFYSYRKQLENLSQWLHNLLNENFGDEQKQNDLEMIGFHCLDRWTSIETTIMQLYKDHL
jgi:spectinomycin phosphotransferase